MKMVMVDLETLSTTKNALILSIGAVVFDMYNVLNETFYQNVEALHQFSFRHTDTKTIEFWDRPEQKEAKASLTENAVGLKDALQSFRTWCLKDTDKEDIQLWCNGTSFDLAILETAYKDIGTPMPWKFFNERDYRTMKNVFRHVPKPTFSGTQHNALADAINQAQHLVDIFAAIRRPEEQR